MKEFKRILLSEDTEKLNEMVGHVNRLKPYLMDLKVKYEALEIGTFTNAIFQDIVNHGTEKIKKKYQEFLADELNNVGLNSNLIRNNLTKESEKHFDLFNESYKTLVSFRIPYYGIHEFHQIPLGLISYAENRNLFHVNEEGRENIKEQFCRLYIDTPEEKNLYYAFVKIKDAYNEFLDIAKGYPKTKNAFHGLDGLKNYITDARQFILYNTMIEKEDQRFQNYRSEINNERLMRLIKHLTINK